MKTKKILALLLAGCMAIGAVGCGNGSDKKDNDKDSKVSAEIPDYINMDSQLPIVKEGTDVTLEIMIVNGPLYSNLDSIKDVYFTQAY